MNIKFQPLWTVGLIFGLSIIAPVQAAGTFEGEIYSTSGGFRFPDNSLQTTAANNLSNVVTVSAFGGDYSSPIDALDAIIDAAEDNPYLLKIGPGVYDLGASSLLMKPYVGIEGSGQGVTIIQGNVDGTGSLPPAAAVVHGSDNATLRNLTVKNIGGGSAAVAILISGVSPKIADITAVSFGGIDRNFGISMDQSSAILTDVTTSSEGGIASNNSGVYIRDSSPALTRVAASSQGGSSCTGVDIVGGSDPIIKYSTIDASACVTAYSVFVINNSNPTIEESTLDAEGTSASIGVSFAGPSDPTLLLKSVTIKASAAVSTKAVFQGSSLSANFIIINSHLEGDTASIHVLEGTAKVIYSRLEGGAPIDESVSGGVFTCVGNYSIASGTPVPCP